MIWAAIRSGMERNGINSITTLAEESGISKATLTHTRRKDPNSFIWREIKQIDKVLGFTPQEWEELRK